jgi:hypothetical protein
MSVWVVNASPLILLGKVARLELLACLASGVEIPAEVAAEIRAGPVNDPARLWLASGGRDFVVESVPFDLRVVAWDLGSGETAVDGGGDRTTGTVGSERQRRATLNFQQ